MLAMKSAGPKMIVSTRGDDAAIASTLVRPERVLDLRLDADPADLEAHRLLDLGEQRVEGDDLLGRLHLRQHDAVEVRARVLHDLDDVAVGPLRRPVVDAHHPHLRAVPALVEGRDHVLACIRLGDGRHGVLEVEEHLVGGEALGLLQHLGVAARHGQVGAARAQGAVLGAHGTDPTNEPTAMLTRGASRSAEPDRRSGSRARARRTAGPQRGRSRAAAPAPARVPR